MDKVAAWGLLVLALGFAAYVHWFDRAPAQPAPWVEYQAPPPGYVLDPPAVVDTAQVDRVNANSERRWREAQQREHDFQMEQQARRQSEALEAAARGQGVVTADSR